VVVVLVLDLGLDGWLVLELGVAAAEEQTLVVFELDTVELVVVEDGGGGDEVVVS